MQTLQHFDRNFLSLTLMQHATAALCGTFVIRVLKLRCRSPLFALGLWEGWFRAGLEAAENPTCGGSHLSWGRQRRSGWGVSVACGPPHVPSEAGRTPGRTGPTASSQLLRLPAHAPSPCAAARQYKPMPAELQNWGFYRLVCVYTLGFCLTNGAFGAVNASLVDTVKAGEPIATVILTLLFLPGEKVTLPIFLSLLPIVAGVAVSSMSDASFQLLGLAMAMGSNLCFSARSICAKLLRSTLGKQMDNANLFVHVNAYGAMALLPAVLLMEGPALYEQLVEGGPARRLLILNGVVYWLNNQMNFLVLEKVDAVTHGLINCGRRVANIAFAIVWFRVPVTIFNGIGMALALFGTFSYMRAKQQMCAAGPTVRSAWPRPGLGSDSSAPRIAARRSKPSAATPQKSKQY